MGLVMFRSLVVVLLLHLSCLGVYKAGAASRNATASGDQRLRDQFERVWSPRRRVAWCESQPHLQELYANIPNDLKRWQEAGISLELMKSAVAKYTLRGKSPTRKGFFAGFRQGVAMLPDAIHFQRNVGHHASLFFVYMRVLVDLQRLFGPLLPDVDFIINTFDCPGLLVRGKQQPLPVMRFAKSPAHADILVPNYHLYSQRHNNPDQDLATMANQQFPWEARKPTLFARFTFFERYILANDPFTQRTGYQNVSLCRATGYSYGASMLCGVRKHFAKWSAKYRPMMDIASNPRVPLLQHAAYKYLAHVDGAGLSTKFDQLLMLGSLIFKEESGYYAFYHHLLKPWVHYVPFWNKTPEDILDQLQWAEANDDKARQIGEAAQQLGRRYITREARACYWYKLLTEYAKLLRYKPAAADAVEEEYWQYSKPVARYLEEDAPLFFSKDGAWLDRVAFHP